MDTVDLKIPATRHPGKPVSSGQYCEGAKGDAAAGVVAVTELKAGEGGEIAYLAATDPQKMRRLLSMGMFPGGRLRLSRTFPSYIFHIGNSDFAVDVELAREIFVRKG